MSQYPQYPPPNYPSPYPMPYSAMPGFPPADPYAPARRAAVLMIILGICSILFGGCFGALGAMIPTLRSNAELNDVVTRMETQIGISASSLFLGMAIFVGVIGLLQIVLGIFVRGGGLGSVITSLVLTSLIALYLGFNTIAGLFQPNALVGVVLFLFVLSAYILLIVWLIQAARNCGAIRAMKLAGYGGWPQPGMPPMAQGEFPPGTAFPPPPGYAPPPNYAQGYGYGYGQPSQPPPANEPPRPPAE